MSGGTWRFGRGRKVEGRARGFRRVGRRLLVVLAAAGLAAGLAADARAERQAARPAVVLHNADVLALWQQGRPAAELGGAFEPACKLAGGEAVAFEEHPRFVYAVGRSPGLVRRVLFLKPSTLVIDDDLHATGPVRWRLDSRSRIACRTLLPADETAVKTAGDENGAGYVVAAAPPPGTDGIRFLHVLHVGEGEATSTLVRKPDRIELSVTADGRTFRLGLPPVDREAGTIELTGADGETLLARRRLPAGVLPHGAAGIRLLDGWDSRYRRDTRPPWDIGRPSSELKKAVEEGTLRPCRAVVLGCGTGTNAIWLAEHGFDVTGIDLAPTALGRAEKKARDAGVEVRWLLADVLAPPKLEPFDLIYDRGCYHGVRRQNAAGYVASVRRLSRPGTRVLILAGNANEPPPRRGPPRVKEEEIRGDFSAGFAFEWLRQTRFDTMEPGGKGAWAWSVLLRRKQP